MDQPTITVKDRQSGETVTYRMVRECVTLGRDIQSFIVLSSKRISRNHAEIRFEDEHFFVVDLESGNGTYLNNQRLEPREKILLKNRDKIRIEKFDIVFTTNGTSQPDFGDITDSDILEIKMIKKLLRSIDKEHVPVLEVVGGAHTGKQFILEGKKKEVLIGRDPECEFQLDDEVISRKHVRIVKKWDTVTIIDLGSKNGLFVNDARVDEHVLSDGDRILLGTLPLVFRNPSEAGLDYLAAEPPPKTEAPPEPTEDAGGRVARRTTETETEEQEATPTDTSEEIPEPEQKAGEGEVATPPEEEILAETKVPLWERFSPLEIATAIGGLIILLGSIWLLLKLL